MDGGIGQNWLEHVFNAEIAEKAGGKPQVLIVDGYSSHYMAEFIHYAWKNNIIVLGYPPHCTHALQGCLLCKDEGQMEKKKLQLIKKLC